jgi:tetratricopeptide (TPR) repeat protein
MKSNQKFSVQSILMQAAALKAEGKYKEAIALLEAALLNYPRNKQLTALLHRMNLLYKVRG